MDFITIISHQPSSEQYSRGCLMDSHGGEFETLVFAEVQAAADYHARVRFRDAFLESWVTNHYLTVLYAGFPVIDPENQVNIGDDTARQFDWSDHSHYEVIQKQFAELEEEAFQAHRRAHDEAKARREEAERVAKEAEEQRRAADSLVARREAYERLKKEFGE